MKRTTLALAGGTVAWAAVAAARRNRWPSREVRLSHPHRAVATAIIGYPTLTGAAFGWSFSDFTGGIWGFVSGLGSDIKGWVLDVVNFAIEKALNLVQVVTDGIEWTVTQFGNSISYVAGQVNDVARAVGGVVMQTVIEVEGAFSNFRQNIKDLFEGFWHDFEGIIKDIVPDIVKGLFGDLWDFLQALWGIGLDGVQFLINLIDDPIGFLWELLKDIVGDAIDTALGELDDLWTLLGRIWHILEWLASHADDLTEEVLSKLWGILKWFVTHIDDFTIEAFESVLATGSDAFNDRVIQALTERSDDLESMAAGWFN